MYCYEQLVKLDGVCYVNLLLLNYPANGLPAVEKEHDVFECELQDGSVFKYR